MVMEKKLNPMVNRFVIFLLISLCSYAILSCKNGYLSRPIEVCKNNIIDSLSIVFKPDTVINNKLILDDYSSLSNFYKELDKVFTINNLRKSPVVVFCDKNKTEYLYAYQYEGNTKNSFSCFEVGLCSTLTSEYLIINNCKGFSTESGLKLGMTINDIEKIKGNNYLKSENKITYKISETNSSFLLYHNMPEYFLECIFKNDKLIRLKFGFSYP
jgi:hypothetical protein